MSPVVITKVYFFSPIVKISPELYSLIVLEIGGLSCIFLIAQIFSLYISDSWSFELRKVGILMLMFLPMEQREVLLLSMYILRVYSCPEITRISWFIVKKEERISF